MNIRRMENEQKSNVEVENVEMSDAQDVFDLTSEEDRKELQSELEKSSMYFKPEPDVTYKVILTSPNVRRVEKEFKDGPQTKYEIAIQATNAQGKTFEGIWECGKSVLEPIFKGYSESAVFKITKTGTGKETRYSVIKDF